MNDGTLFRPDQGAGGGARGGGGGGRRGGGGRGPTNNDDDEIQVTLKDRFFEASRSAKRRKGLTAMMSWEPADWMHTKAVVKKVRDAWNAAGEVNAWLDTHVGPSTLPPPDFDR